MRVPAWIGLELIEVSYREKIVSALGGGLAILNLVLVSTCVLPVAESVAVITSMGASAVLLFAVPHGPLSQPWPVIGGNLLSAIIGVTCARMIPEPAVAAACAVGLSIAVMMQLKCIHPPGGATALAAVLGGPALRELGYGYVLCPVTCNAVVMVLLAMLFNSPFAWRRYPASWGEPLTDPSTSTFPTSHEDILTAIRQLDSFVDIDEDDLRYLVELLSKRSQNGTAMQTSE